ncbi:MAG: hypothetical protein J0626_01375, partial [Rhodospirillaceae bacterium]|nr:hypothetical protein [Rhodospirillaceae bacterium]
RISLASRQQLFTQHLLACLLRCFGFGALACLQRFTLLLLLLLDAEFFRRRGARFGLTFLRQLRCLRLSLRFGSTFLLLPERQRRLIFLFCLTLLLALLRLLLRALFLAFARLLRLRREFFGARTGGVTQGLQQGRHRRRPLLGQIGKAL